MIRLTAVRISRIFMKMLMTKWLPLLLICCVACVPKALHKSEGSAESVSASGQLLFLTLELRSEEGEVVVQSLQTKKVAGRMKAALPPRLEIPDALLVRFLDDAGHEVLQVGAENPLHRWVETSDESGKMKRQEVILKQGTIVLRVPYTDAMQVVEILNESEESLAQFVLTL